MDKPVLYTATVRGIPNVLFEGEIINGRLNGLYPISIGVNRDFVLIDDVVDLQQVEIVKAGATVVEGVTEPLLLRFLNLAVLYIPLDKYEDDWARIGLLAKQLNDKLITERDAQLSPPVRIPEPKVGQRIIAFYGGTLEEDCDVFLRFTDSPDLDRHYVSVITATLAKWSDLIKPSRMGEE